ncbi:MAG: PQQ-binding-like beta-propeller repeat protein [Planctomycetaceae bacterium]
MRTPTLLAAIAVCCLANDLQAEDWPQFRGPDSLGAASDTGLPVAWSDSKNLVWKAKLPGAGASSPITVGDRMYVTCYSGYSSDGTGDMNNLKLHLTCLNRQTGDIVFDKKLEPTLPESERVRDHGYAAATPATDGESVYVFFGKSGVVRFDMEGNQIWRQSVGDGTHKWGCGTSPVLHGDVVIVNASVESGSLVALSKKDGKEVWRQGGMVRSWNTPHLVKVGEKHELVVSVKDKILAFDPATGKEIWTCEGIHDYVCPSIISQDGIVYAIGGRQSQCIAVKAGGKGEVKELWRARVGANVSSPIIHDGHLYWVSDRNKVAYCVNIKNGDVVYKERFPGQPYASTIVADGKLYVVTRFGGTYVLAATPEYKQLAHNEFEDKATFNASPIVSGGKLFLRSDAYLYCIGKG